MLRSVEVYPVFWDLSGAYFGLLLMPYLAQPKTQPDKLVYVTPPFLTRKESSERITLVLPLCGSLLLDIFCYFFCCCLCLSIKIPPCTSEHCLMAVLSRSPNLPPGSTNKATIKQFFCPYLFLASSQQLLVVFCFFFTSACCLLFLLRDSAFFLLVHAGFFY